MELARFVSGVIRIALLLALVGQLKSCTLEMMGLAAEASVSGMMSYSKYTRVLTR